MTTTSTTTSTTTTDKFQIVKRFKVTCPICGKKIWNDAVEYHKKADACY